MTWIAVVFSLVCAVGGVGAGFFFARQWSGQNEAEAKARAWKAGHQAGAAETAKERARLEKRLRDHELLLRDASGGVGQRVAEVREIAMTILKHAPGLYRQADGLLQRLGATDEFLLQLLSLSLEDEDTRDMKQVRRAMFFPRRIFADIIDAAHVSPPNGVSSQHFSVALEFGCVAIRSARKHGASGKILLGRQDFVRFFNDLPAPPRGLDGARSADWSFAGLFRVDTRNDPKAGQLMVTSRNRHAGRLFLGQPEHEASVLADLRNLRTACQQALEKASVPATRATRYFVRALQERAHDASIPESGVCPHCACDLTAFLRPGDPAQHCPVCHESLAAAAS